MSVHLLLHLDHFVFGLLDEVDQRLSLDVGEHGGGAAVDLIESTGFLD